MALNLPPNFKNDIQGRDTNLIPVVFIGNAKQGDGWTGWLDDIPPIIISTNSGVFQAGQFGSQEKPLLLNIPSIKESIDIEKRNYKISSVNIDISNFPHDGERFSELVGDSSLINTECRIQWASPSAINFSAQDFPANPFPPTDEDMFFAFTGTIRKYDMTDEKVRLVVEDRSQAALHKDLPLPDNYLTEDNGYIDVPDKYKNKPIPMVYGYVDRSPCVIDKSQSVTAEDIYGNINLLFDVAPPELIETNNTSWVITLRIFDNDTYLLVPNDLKNIGGQIETNASTDVDTSYYGAEGSGQDIPQWVRSGSGIFGNAITLISSGSHENDTLNPVSDNSLIVMQHLDDMRLAELKLKSTYWSTIVGAAHYTSAITQTDEANDSIAGTFASDFGTNSSTFSWDGTSQLSNMPEATVSDIPEGWVGHPTGIQWGLPASTWITGALSEGGKFEKRIGRLIYDIDIYAGNMSTDAVAPITLFNTELRVGGDTQNDGEFLPLGGHYISNNSASSWNHINSELGYLYIENVDKLLIYIRPIEYNKVIGALKLHFKQLRIENYIKAKDLISHDYYGAVFGRYTDYYVAETQSYLPQPVSPTAPVIIKDILERELNQTGVDITGTYGWQYAFCQNTKINSKKLIENISSASPYIPRFNNMGKFIFTEIPVRGGAVPEGNTIKEADVIDFSFSRTSINDVYTKIVFNYKWDYARDDFSEKVEVDISSITSLNSYKPEYYGFKVEAGVDYDHAESTLEISDDRGKYIRGDYSNTAQEFAYWYLMWSCNQKLKMKIKLPLKYMFLEIGDFIDFDDILGNVKPYGINYKIDDIVNEQAVFKNFMITSTNKTLEWVEIECIQMHNLDPECEYDCRNICGGDAYTDECGQCVTEEIDYGFECDCADIPEGDCDCDGAVLDDCGICGGGGAIFGIDEDCCELDLDECGVCNGDNSTCYGCMDSEASNYMPDASQPCNKLEGFFAETECCEYTQPWTQEPHYCLPLLASGQLYSTTSDIIITSANELNYEEPYCNGFFEPNPNNLDEMEIRLSTLNNDSNYDDHPVFTIYDGWVKFDSLTTTNENWNAMTGIDFEWIKVNIKTLHNEENVVVIAPEQYATQSNGDIWWDPVDEYSTTETTWVRNLFGSDDASDSTPLFYIIPEKDENGVEIDSTHEIALVFDIHTLDAEDGEMVTYTEVIPLTVHYSPCPVEVGDLNGDGIWNILDIVALANCILEDVCSGIQYPCAADVNNDDGWSVLDIVILANCVLVDGCGG